MAVNRGNSVDPLQRAHIHEGSQRAGGSSREFRQDWTHTFGTIRTEVKARVVHIDGESVQRGLQTATDSCVKPRLG